MRPYLIYLSYHTNTFPLTGTILSMIFREFSAESTGNRYISTFKLQLSVQMPPLVLIGKEIILAGRTGC